MGVFMGMDVELRGLRGVMEGAEGAEDNGEVGEEADAVGEGRDAEVEGRGILLAERRKEVAWNVVAIARNCSKERPSEGNGEYETEANEWFFKELKWKIGRKSADEQNKSREVEEGRENGGPFIQRLGGIEQIMETQNGWNGEQQREY